MNDLTDFEKHVLINIIYMKISEVEKDEDADPEFLRIYNGIKTKLVESLK